MAKKKIIGYFQFTVGATEQYVILADKKAWDSSGEMPDFVDDKIYEVLDDDEFWEVAGAVFATSLSLADARSRLIDLGFLEKEIVEDEADWIP